MRKPTFILFAALALSLSGDLGCKSKKNIVEVHETDPEMNAAIAEARQRWPEFVAAFAARKEGDSFLAKYPFTTAEGPLEHIWLVVTEITPDKVDGTINNEPYGHIGHQLGDQVTIPSRDISDWAYTTEGSKEVVGGFTIKVMTKREGK